MAIVFYIFLALVFDSIWIGWEVCEVFFKPDFEPLNSIFMNAKTAICSALLQDRVISIRTGFVEFSVTNLPREISRQVEKPFNVQVSKTRKIGKTRWGVDCSWFEYRLNRTEYNADGIAKMIEYVKANTNQNPKTDKEAKQLKQTKMALQ